MDFTPLTERQKATWRRQCRALAGYAIAGELTSAAAFAGCTRPNLNYWLGHDTFGFRDRFAEARDRFSDRLETIAHHRVEAQKPNDNPLLLITLLNANRPDKYRPSATPVDESVKSVLAALQALGTQSLAARNPQR